MKKEPFLKGALTKISAALLLLVQSPNLLADLSDASKVFAENSEQPIAILSLVAAAGVIWGGAYSQRVRRRGH